MTSILRQENGELFIYRSEDKDQYRADWIVTAERIKVAEGEKEKFNTFTYHIQVEMRTHEPYKEGIPIPESCYEVREPVPFYMGSYYNKCSCCGEKFIGDKRQPVCKKCCDNWRLAYFKDDRATEKETPTHTTYPGVLRSAVEGWKKPERLHDTPQESQTLMKEQEELWNEVIEDLKDFVSHYSDEALIKVFSERFFLSRK